MTRAFRAQRIMSKLNVNNSSVNNLKPALVIGVGNELRNDDAAGLIAARELKSTAGKNTAVIESDGDGAKIMEQWKDYDNIILIDAVSFNSKPGTIHILDAGEKRFPKEASIHSSHLFSVAEAIETARVLGKLPKKIKVYGIEGKSYELGNEVSDEVKTAIHEVVKLIEKEISI